MNAQKTDSLSTAIYHPEADASLQIREAMTRAKKENKHVFLQIGGNWCTWCRRFNNLVTTNDTLETLLTNQYVVAHINYSPENKNLPVLATLGYPQRFGFPVFVILDANGQRLHTQNSGYLEEGKGHSVKKIADFLKDWSPSALDAHKYE
ncbi:MAG: thioredoxin family protein [Sphingobacteriales bacterium]|nr:MAG: thioredoxin family protein [Sphingobacteriales bacterium]